MGKAAKWLVLSMAGLCWLLAGCSTMTLTKGDLTFTTTRFLNDDIVQGLEATGVNGMEIKLNKHGSNSKDELIRALLEAFLQ